MSYGAAGVQPRLRFQTMRFQTMLSAICGMHRMLVGDVIGTWAVLFLPVSLGSAEPPCASNAIISVRSVSGESLLPVGPASP